MSPIDMLAHRMEALSDTTLRRSFSAHPERYQTLAYQDDMRSN